MDKNLLLRIRTEALQANLVKVKGYLETVPDRKIDLDNLLAELGKNRTCARETKIQLDAAKQILADENESSLALPYLETAAKAIQTAFESVKSAQQMVAGMKQSCFRIQEEGMGKSFKGDLQKRTEPCLGSLENVEDGLRAGDANAKLWEKYRDKASEPSQQIFSEYVEFLGGLALRDTGFDAGISLVADELIQTYKTNRITLFPLLAIPARQQAVAMTLARVIRVGFPEWTIWALPFTAHEFWHIVAREDLDTQLRLEIASLNAQGLYKGEGAGPVAAKLSESVEQRLQTCLADAFATYTMGPAYAYSAIVLLLNPWRAFSADDRNVADDTRAQAIFQMLECMDRKGSGGDTPPYQKVRADLQMAWAAAIEQANPPKDDALHQRCQAEGLQVRLSVEALWNKLDEANCAPFLVSHWIAIQDWPDKVLAGKEQDIQLPAGVELRHVLNAVWLARVAPNRCSFVDLTERSNRLSDRVRAFQRDVAASRTSSPLSGKYKGISNAGAS